LASLVPVGTKLGSTMQLAVLALWGGSIAGLVGIGLMFVPAFTHSRLMHWLTTWKFVGKIVKELMDSIQLYQGKPQAVIYAALLGMVGHLGFLTVFFLCAQSLHQGRSYPGYVDHIVGLPIAETLAALIPTPGGIGPLEAGIALFYEEHQRAIDPNNQEMLTAAASNGLLTALGYRLTTWICGAIGIVYYFSSRKEISRAVHVTEGEPLNDAELMKVNSLAANESIPLTLK